ncbi:uncharacterized protein LOC108865027 [Galendromus occidentalis]|uniref:Uncharacterized protein LOC108865027 n=1 Tax=Galendromus occidentalis TaxID=34638 RepID=A0AAJ7WIZ7_9ACAR|nr:uncharacterized protein LOC108865027 [Galendromus occidentalis]
MTSLLCESGTVFMDGTFKVVPQLFTQLYTLHCFYKGQMFPMLDFEVAALRAIQHEFPLSGIKGCNFHYNQCLWRKVQASGLVPYYSDPLVKRLIRSCSALSLVPLDRMDDAWLAIDADSPPTDHPAYERVETFKDYFIQTWLENPDVFPRSMWNHFGNFGARTTNHVEAWHSALSRTVRKDHVNIFELINFLKKQEDKGEADRLLLRAGQPPPKLSTKYKVLNDRLIRLTGELETGVKTLIEYIHSVGYNLNNN